MNCLRDYDAIVIFSVKIPTASINILLFNIFVVYLQYQKLKIMKKGKILYTDEDNIRTLVNVNINEDILITTDKGIYQIKLTDNGEQINLKKIR